LPDLGLRQSERDRAVRGDDDPVGDLDVGRVRTLIVAGGPNDDRHQQGGRGEGGAGEEKTTRNGQHTAA
jgi:hypothetical protein